MDDKELRKKAYKVIKNYCWECAEDDSVHRKGFHSNQVNEWVTLFHSEMAKNLGFMRQWLNEDRITDPKKMVTTKELESWMTNSRLSKEEHEK